MVAVAFEWLGRKKNKEQTLVVLALGFLVMLAAVFSAMRGGEEYKGEMRTKSLVYESDGTAGIGLYWMDDKANLRKATPEEVERCKELHPDEVIPVCQTAYYEESENKQ